MDDATLQAQIDQLRAENERLKAARAGAGTITLRVSAKGALSAYGLGRWPVTLYQEQWLRLMTDGQVKAVKDFIAAHQGELKSKPAAE